MGFTTHGQFVIHTDRRILRVDAWGPWNLECTLDYSREMKRHIETMPTPFAILAISHEQAVLGPEAEAILRYNVRWRVSHGCTAQATVLEDLGETAVARSLYKRLYVPEGLIHGVFRDVAGGAQWLVDRGFPEAVELARYIPKRPEFVAAATG
jgi:hypothetical protein